MFAKRMTAVGASLGIIIFLVPITANAAIKYWDPADGIGNWNYGPYWSPSGVPVADDIVRIEAGGSGWTLICNYICATNPLLDDVYIGNAASGTADARLIQGQDALHADKEYVGYNGTGKHFQSGGSVTLDGTQYLGYQSGSDGYYELSLGTLTSAYGYVAYGGDGDFLQTGGTHTCGSLRISNANYGGPYGEGTYTLQGGTLDTDLIYLGGKETGSFTHSGGTVNATVVGLTLGLDDYGPGVYVLTGGDLNTYRTRLSWAGSTFTHTGGTHDVSQNLEIGYAPDLVNTAVYELSGSGVLTVSGNLVVSINGLACYTQNGGTATISGEVQINADGTFFLSGGTLNAAMVVNDNTFEQSGGEFVGHVENNGTFTYGGGQFDESTLTNNGTVNFNADLTCRRLVNEASLTLMWDRWLFGTGTGYANAVENNGNLSMYPRSHIDVGNDSKLVNNGPMYAGGPGSDYAHIFGDVENNDYLLPCHSGLPSGWLYINGDFTAATSAELRIRIHGTDTEDYDRLAVQGTATLAGELDVRLTSGFVPAIGDSFSVVATSARVGQFNPVYLPTLPSDREWELSYTATGVTLAVVEAGGEQPGDLDCDGDVDFDDINPFVLALSGEAAYNAQYPDCRWLNADCDGDEDVDFDDINPFVALIGS